MKKQNKIEPKRFDYELGLKFRKKHIQQDKNYKAQCELYEIKENRCRKTIALVAEAQDILRKDRELYGKTSKHVIPQSERAGYLNNLETLMVDAQRLCSELQKQAIWVHAKYGAWPYPQGTIPVTEYIQDLSRAILVGKPLSAMGEEDLQVIPITLLFLRNGSKSEILRNFKDLLDDLIALRKKFGLNTKIRTRNVIDSRAAKSEALRLSKREWIGKYKKKNNPEEASRRYREACQEERRFRQTGERSLRKRKHIVK